MRSLGSKIVLLVVSVIAVMGLIVAGIQLWVSWNQIKQEKLNVQTQIRELFVPMLAQAYWVYDMDQVNRMMRLVSKQSFVGQVTLVGQFDGSYTHGREVALSDQEQVYFELNATALHDTPQQISSDNANIIGTLYVVFDKKAMLQALVDVFITLMQTQFILLLMIAGAFLTGLVYFVSKPLQYLTKALAEPSEIKLSELISNPFSKNWAGTLEVENLFRSVNKMRFSIHKQIARQSLLQKQLERYVKLLHNSNSQLKVIFDSIGDAVIVTDHHFNVSYANQNAIQMPLMRKFLRKGESFLRLIDANTCMVNCSSNLERKISNADGKLVRTEIALDMKDDEYRYYMFNCASFKGDNDHKSYVFLLNDISEYKRMFGEIEYLATHDYLTETLNRYSFESRMISYLDAAAQVNHSARTTAVLLYINVDHFRVVNDSVGRVAGDELLRQVAKLLKRMTSTEDFLARLESDVFALVTPVDSKVNAKIKAGLVAASVNGYEFFWGRQKFIISISIGAVLLPSTAIGIDSLLQFADGCCRKAKMNGQQKVAFFSADVEDRLLGERQEIASLLMLEDAIRTNQLKLFLQEIVPLGGLPVEIGYPEPVKKRSYELLVRIQQANGDLTYPSAFIPSAEHYNKMSLVDRYVIDELLVFIHDNPIWFDMVDHIAINLSGQSLTEAFMLDYFAPKVAKMGVDPTKLCIEVTETVAIADLDKTILIISTLRDKGYLFSLDDFGSGLASYGYLQRIPVNYLKIDGSFIRKICESPVDYKLVESMNSIAHHIGMKTIAEFVENEDILNEVTRLCVDYAQGHYYGQAIPIEKTVAQLVS